MKTTQKLFYAAAIASTLLVAPAIEALLPPLYETINEYKELIANEELGKKLDSGEAILDIERQDGAFLIITNKSTLQVDIVRDAQSQPGPGKFHFVFHDKIPL